MSNLKVKFTASSLADIAQDFERRADEARAQADTKAPTTRHALRAAATAWDQAANILRNTTIDPNHCPRGG